VLNGFSECKEATHLDYYIPPSPAGTQRVLNKGRLS